MHVLQGRSSRWRSRPTAPADDPGPSATVLRSRPWSTASVESPNSIPQTAALPCTQPLLAVTGEPHPGASMRRPSPRHLRGVGQHPRHVAPKRMRHPLLLVFGFVAASLLVAAGLYLPQAQALRQGQAVWSVKCGFSHDAPDDPIVHPGQPGASHLHSFIGNTTTDAA